MKTTDRLRAMETISRMLEVYYDGLGSPCRRARALSAAAYRGATRVANDHGFLLVELPWEEMQRLIEPATAPGKVMN